MRPPRLHFQSSVPIAVIAIAFLIVFSWTVTTASAQDETTQKAAKKGTIHTANNLVVQKYLHRAIYLSGNVYRLTGGTDFLDASGLRVSRQSIPVGTVVNIVYVTDKDTTEAYPFDPKEKVLLKIQIVATKSK